MNREKQQQKYWKKRYHLDSKYIQVEMQCVWESSSGI